MNKECMGKVMGFNGVAAETFEVSVLRCPLFYVASMLDAEGSMITTHKNTSHFTYFYLN